MTTQVSAVLRYPKGWFALTTVYSFTGLAILASIVFSLLLFLSIDDNPLMKWLFGGLAIIFELGKFYVWYEYGECKARRDLGGAFWSLLFYCVLAAISIGGSIGGINSATNTILNQQARHEREIARFDEQIASIERQIQLNEEAARKYIEMARISSGVNGLQQANTKLRLRQDELRQERDAKPLGEQSSMLGLMSSLADGVGMSISQVQFLLVCFLSVGGGGPGAGCAGERRAQVQQAQGGRGPVAVPGGGRQGIPAPAGTGGAGAGQQPSLSSQPASGLNMGHPRVAFLLTRGYGVSG